LHHQFSISASASQSDVIVVDQPRSPDVFLGSALGLAAGGAAGAGVGYLIYLVSDNPDGDMFGGLFAVATGSSWWSFGYLPRIAVGQ
jgi:hypothetical protein